MPEAPGHQRDRQRQRRQQVPAREPEAEHRGRAERRDEQLRCQHEGAEPGRQLDVAHARHRARNSFASGAPQPPQPGERQRQHGRPAQQAVAAVDEQRHQPVRALEMATGKRGVGGRLATHVRGIGGGAPEQPLADRYEQRDAEQRQLDRPDCERAPPCPPQPARGHHADREPGERELGAQPRQRPEQRKADEGHAPRRPGVEPQREERGGGEHRAGGQLRVDRRPVGKKRRRQTHRRGRPDRPRVGHHAQRETVGQRHPQRGQGRQEQLDGLGAADRVRRRDQHRKADPVRLVQPPVCELAVPVERVRIELGVGACRVLVEQVDVAVVDDRLRAQQVVRLVPAVVGRVEGVQPERGGVGGEQQQPEGGGAAHGAGP